MPSAGRITIGNAENFRASRGWFMGGFLDPTHEALVTDDIEMKWGHHPEGEERHELSEAAETASVAILISGRFEIRFPDRAPFAAVLERQGDFVLYEPGIPHTWRALQDSVVLTVRWRPSWVAAAMGRPEANG